MQTDMIRKLGKRLLRKLTTKLNYELPSSPEEKDIVMGFCPL